MQNHFQQKGQYHNQKPGQVQSMNQTINNNRGNMQTLQSFLNPYQNQYQNQQNYMMRNNNLNQYTSSYNNNSSLTSKRQQFRMNIRKQHHQKYFQKQRVKFMLNSDKKQSFNRSFQNNANANIQNRNKIPASNNNHQQQHKKSEQKPNNNNKVTINQNPNYKQKYQTYQQTEQKLKQLYKSINDYQIQNNQKAIINIQILKQLVQLTKCNFYENNQMIANGRQLLKGYNYRYQYQNKKCDHIFNYVLFWIYSQDQNTMLNLKNIINSKEQQLATWFFANILYEKIYQNDAFPNDQFISRIIKLLEIGNKQIKQNCLLILNHIIDQRQLIMKQKIIYGQINNKGLGLFCTQQQYRKIQQQHRQNYNLDLINALINVLSSKPSDKLTLGSFRLYYKLVARLQSKRAMHNVKLKKILKYLTILASTSVHLQMLTLAVFILFQLIKIFGQDYLKNQVKNCDVIILLINRSYYVNNEHFHKKLLNIISDSIDFQTVLTNEQLRDSVYPYFDYLLFEITPSTKGAHSRYSISSVFGYNDRSLNKKESIYQFVANQSVKSLVYSIIYDLIGMRQNYEWVKFRSFPKAIDLFCQSQFSTQIESNYQNQNQKNSFEMSKNQQIELCYVFKRLQLQKVIPNKEAQAKISNKIKLIYQNCLKIWEGCNTENIVDATNPNFNFYKSNQNNSTAFMKKIQQLLKFLTIFQKGFEFDEE